MLLLAPAGGRRLLGNNETLGAEGTSHAASSEVRDAFGTGCAPVSTASLSSVGPTTRVSSSSSAALRVGTPITPGRRRGERGRRLTEAAEAGSCCEVVVAVEGGGEVTKGARADSGPSWIGDATEGDDERACGRGGFDMAVERAPDEKGGGGVESMAAAAAARRTCPLARKMSSSS